MTSETESYQSSEAGEPNREQILAKSYAVDDQTERLAKQINKINGLYNEIADYKSSHVSTVYELREHVTDLAQDLSISRKTMVNLCESRLNDLLKIADPYVKSGKHPAGTTMTGKCFDLLKKADDMKTSILQSEEAGRHVRQDRHLLNRIEAKQQEAITRQSKIESLEALARGFPAGDPLFHVANLPMTLLALSKAPHVSDYYQNAFKSLEERIASFLTRMRIGTTSVASFEMSSQSSFSTTGTNGEIGLNSLHDLTEHSLDEPIGE